MTFKDQTILSQKRKNKSPESDKKKKKKKFLIYSTHTKKNKSSNLLFPKKAIKHKQFSKPKSSAW